MEKNLESCISVSMSPVVDVMYSRIQSKEKCLDLLIQDVRINLSVPFLMHLGRYFLDSLPGEQIEKGIINHGYENNNQTVNKDTFRQLFVITYTHVNMRLSIEHMFSLYIEST